MIAKVMYEMMMTKLKMTKMLFRKSNGGRVDKITTISKDIQDCDMLPKDIAKIP